MAANSAIFVATSSSSSCSWAKKNSYLRIMKLKSVLYDRMQVKVNSLVHREKAEKKNPSSSPKTIANHLTDKSWLPVEGWKPKSPDGLLIDSFGSGRNAEDGFVFCQNFTIRSYEIGPDGKVSLETLMNLLQEVGLNRFKAAGFVTHGFGSTPEMAKRNLIWVATQIHVIVDRYPAWYATRGDVIGVRTWFNPPSKSKMHTDWLVLDFKTGGILARASGVWVTMNKHTRKLSKIPDEVHAEMRPYVVEKPPIINGHGRKLRELNDNTADEIWGHLIPKWTDLDVNEHVNNVKYIGWVLESTPRAMVESHELSSIDIEYKRECGRNNVLQSLIAISGATDGELGGDRVVCQHLLRLRDGPEVLRARTEWRLKHTRNSEMLMSQTPDVN